MNEPEQLEYRMVWEDTHKKFEDAVNAALADGWDLAGGAALQAWVDPTREGSKPRIELAQALTRRRRRPG